MSATADRGTVIQEEGFEAWVVLELLGHRRLGGYLREQEIAGAAFLRIDVPGNDGNAFTQFVNPSSVYAITPTTEEVAREIARQAPAPVTRWDVSALLPKPAVEPADVYMHEYEAGAHDDDETTDFPL